jgi:hypothetical protein
MNVRGVLEDVRTAASMPRVQIVLSRGRSDEESLRREFRRPHPRYKVIRFKTVGVALLPLDDITDADAYLATHSYARRRVRRAARLGYTVGVFNPDDRRAQLLEIHSSIPERQGRPMDPDYLDPHAVYETGPGFEYIGVFRDDVVVGYSKLQYAGDIAAMMRILGHGDHLDDGIMYLLTAEIVAHLKSVRPQARYLYYDTFFGAAAGMRRFKTQLGFRPHYVQWKREPARPDGVSQA